MLKQAKVGLLRFAESTGFSRLLSSSSWRRRRLLILCYHGVSRFDEHQWDNLYIPPATLRRRMELLAEARCHVLPLTEALQRLQDNSLPERAVVITFDDGSSDFFSTAFPILQSFAYPVTLYLTTYYVEFNRPVFDPMCSYLLWKGRHKGELVWPDLFPDAVPLDRAGRHRAVQTIKQFALFQKLSGWEKDHLLARLAQRLDIDYEDLCRQRVLHLINPEEARLLAERGVDLQFHTHRHRVYRSREGLCHELDDNRRILAKFTRNPPRHFCYTGGFYFPEYSSYLKDYGILSATTCEPGLCSPRTDPFLLPRLVDTTTLGEVEFRAWLAGTAILVPRRDYKVTEGHGGQLLEEEFASSNRPHRDAREPEPQRILSPR